MITPPQALSIATANSVVGVEAKPMLITSKPMLISVPQTTWLTISPEMRASRPTTILRRYLRLTTFSRKLAKAATDLAISTGLSVSPLRPPIVPRNPEIDLIKVILFFYFC